MFLDFLKRKTTRSFRPRVLGITGAAARKPGPTCLPNAPARCSRRSTFSRPKLSTTRNCALSGSSTTMPTSRGTSPILRMRVRELECSLDHSLGQRITLKCTHQVTAYPLGGVVYYSLSGSDLKGQYLLIQFHFHWGHHEYTGKRKSSIRPDWIHWSLGVFPQKQAVSITSTDTSFR